MNNIEQFCKDVKTDIEKFDTKLDKMAERMAALESNRGLAELLVRWCVFPLIIILGGLVGIKVIWPAL